MRAHPVLLQKKYARIIALLAKRLSITTMRALDLFYHSDTYALMREGVADMHRIVKYREFTQYRC